MMNRTHSFLFKFRGNSFPFTESSFHLGFAHKLHSAVVKVNSLNDAFNLFDEMSLRCTLPSVVKFNQLLTVVTKMNHYASSLDIFNQMCAIGVPVDQYTISIAIKCCCQLNRTKDGFALLGSCFRRSISPDVYIFNALLDGLVLEDRFFEGLCNNHLFEDALSLFHLVGDGKLNIDIVVYTILIDGAGKCGKFHIARDLFLDLNDKGLKPNVRTYNVMISGFCRDGQLVEARSLFLKMGESGCSPNNVTYCVFVQGCLKNKHYDDVEMLLQEMEDRCYSLDASTLSLFIDQIAAGYLDRSMLNLLGKLVPKE